MPAQGGHPVIVKVGGNGDISAYWIVRPWFAIAHKADDDNEHARRAHKKKAAWFPRRPFLSHDSTTLTGDFRTSAPGAYLPAVS
jgi:hypothetical protein